MIEGVNHGKRCLAFAQVAGHRLAQHFFARRQIQHIVDNLEREPHRTAIRSQARFFGFAGAGQHSAQPHGHGKQTRRLAEDQIVILGLGDSLAQLLNLQQLALDHLLGQSDQQLQHAEVLLFKRHLECLHVEPVSGQHALFVAPGGIGRGPAAPGVRRVDDVVVHQRSGMHHFHDRAQADRPLPRVTQHMRGKQQQRRPYPLAAALAQILGNLGDGADAGGGIATQLLLDGHQVIPQKVKKLSPRLYR